jgi:hypothetical protein
MKEFSAPDTVMLDIDHRRQAPALDELYKVFHVLQITPEWIRQDKTRHGWHVVIKLPRRLHKLALVALQAILGSDPRRETLNLMRALSIGMTGFAAERWNILFERKLD